MPSAFINDGYNLDSTIPAVPGVSPEFRFTYRLCKIERRLAYSNAAGFCAEAQAEDGSKLIREHLIEISARNDAGQWERLDLPSWQDVARLHGVAWFGIIAHVTGQVGPTPAADAPKS